MNKAISLEALKRLVLTPLGVLINRKVDKVAGKGLSTNDYTNEEKEKLANISTVSMTGDYNDLFNKPEIPSTEGLATELYVDDVVSTKVETAVTNLVNSAPETLDTLGEIVTAMQENEEVVDALNAAIGNKVDKVDGKDLSTNDYTNEDKEKLANLSTNAVLYTAQEKTDEEKAQARENIAAVNSWDELEDRPFGEETVLSRSAVHEETFTSYSSGTSCSLNYSLWKIENEDVVVTINGTEYESTCTFNSGSYVIELDDGFSIKQHVTNDMATIYGLDTSTYYEIKIEVVEATKTVAQLDEKYIPETIMRVAQFEDYCSTVLDEERIPETIMRVSQFEDYCSMPKDSIYFKDQVNGYTYIACMRNGNFVTYCAVESIECTTLPNKTEYMASEYFDPTGMVIAAITYDGTTKEIIDYTYPTDRLIEGVTSIEIVYKENGLTYTVSVPINVSAFDAENILIDFEYTDNGDGTYTITDWKGTYNGETSTEIIIPDYECIIV